MSWHSLSAGLRTGAPLAFGALIVAAFVALVVIGAAAMLLVALLVL